MLKNKTKPSRISGFLGKTITLKDFLIALLLFILFFSVYFELSYQIIQRTPIAKHDDILFEIDAVRAITDMTDFSGNHHRTEVHPIYVLLVNPIGEVLSRIISTNEMTSVVINVFFGAAATALAYFIFRLLQTKWIPAVLLTALFGFSTSQLFLSTIPDTASLAVLSLLITYALFIYSLEYAPIHDGYWVIAGILTLGVTTTNFAQTLILYVILQFKALQQQNSGLTLWKITRFAFSVLAITILLALLQKWIYPSSTLFFLPQVYFSELDYASTSIFSEPLRIASIVFKSFLADTIIAPRPVFFELPLHNIPAVTFTGASAYMVDGVAGLILWISLLGLGLIHLVKEEKTHLLTFAIIVCLAFNFALHSFYGIGEKNKIELFLYTGNLTFLLILLTAGWVKTTRKSYFLLIPLLTAGAINNILILQQIIQFLSS